MRRRGVQERDVEYLLENYDTRLPARPLQGAAPAEILVGEVGGRRLRVYVEIGSSPPRVKTVAWV
jgi:hypothetical protein